MDNTPPQLFVFARKVADAKTFVEFWSGCYEYPDCELYTPNINGPVTRETLKHLFNWKIGPRFFKSQWPDIERLFVDRLEEALAVPQTATADELLATFPEGGAIYRIFWLHCLRPLSFPIYDQHIHRAMNLIEGRAHRELAKFTQQAQVRLYVEQYVPFWTRQFADIESRAVDQALWAFGKFMNEKRKTSFA